MTELPLPILYSFRRCPYAIRARIVLLLCAQDVELREVLLANKPVQMQQVSAKATVPVLCLPDGNILDESLDIMQWAIARSLDPEKLFSVASEQQSQLDLIKHNDTEFKHWLDRYKYHTRHPEHPPEYYQHNAEQFLGILEAHLIHSPYLFGKRPQLADVAIMPFVRQLAGVDRKWFDNTHYSAVKIWLANWLSSQLLINAMVKYPPWSTDQITIVLTNT